MSPGGETEAGELRAALDRQAIRDVLETWVVARDAGLWPALLGTWHAGGRMRSTWSSGSAEDFVAAVRQGFERGSMAHHSLGGSLIELAGDRAVAQTKMTIAMRVPVDGVECDVVCTGRFYDFFARRDGRWGIALRHPIYEKDRLDPVPPGAIVPIDDELLASFPSGCRWLLYAQHRLGMPIIAEQAGLRGELVEGLYREGASWLAGGPVPD